MNNRSVSIFHSILLIAYVLLISNVSSAQDHSFDIVADEAKAASLRFNMPSNRNQELTANYDITYHHIEWEVDPALGDVSGLVKTVFTTKTDMSEMYFDLNSSMTVSEVILDGESTSFSQSNDLLNIEFSNSFAANTSHEVEVRYSGTPNSSGFGSFQIANHEGVPVLWTLSEPYGAKDWWPCKQDLTDKIDSIDVYVTTPIAYKVACNGTLESVVIDGDFATHHWKHRFPIPAYLIGIAVTNYEEFSVIVPFEGEDIEILNYVFPENIDLALNQTEEMTEAMTMLSEKFGIYPYHQEKYGHAQWESGGGMEHTTMSFMVHFGTALIVHELAHQWFGNKVTCGSWQDIWLNEGFARYSVALYYEKKWLEDSDYPYWNNWKVQQVDLVTAIPDGSVFVNDTTDVFRIFSSRLSYSKGAYLLHMLRWELGDDVFYESIREYLDDPDLAFSYARTIDLIEHLESVSGQDLEEYFADWFYGEGYPSHSIKYTQSDGVFYLKANQSQSHSSVSFFELTMPILLKSQDDEILLRLDLDYDGQYYEIPVDFDVTEVVFDPDLWLLSNENTVLEDNSLLTSDPEVTLFPNPIRDQLSILFDAPMKENMQLLVYDLSGKKVYESELNRTQIQKVDLSMLVQGKYEINISNAQKTIRKSIIIE